MEQAKASRPKLTDEERATLARKLDDELEEFMERMAAKKAAKIPDKKPFDFDDWCRDIDQHPAFMKDLGTGLNGRYAETISALQALKYDEGDMEDREATALRHKQEGNKHFRLEKYHWATCCYSEGIKVQCLNRKVNSVLYGNRAASQKRLGNLRSAVKDCIMACRFDPTNLKAVCRGADCLLKLGYGRECIDWIENARKAYAFARETEEEEISKLEKKQLEDLELLRHESFKVAEIEERNERRARAEERKDLEEKTLLLKALSDRKLNLRPRLPFHNPELMDWSLLEVNLPQTSQRYRVSFNEQGNLQWPFLIQYPQVGQVDVLTECDETSQLASVLRPLLKSPAEWDHEHEFRLDNVRVFVQDEWNDYVMEVWEWSTFGSVLCLTGFQIVQGLPVLMVFTRDKVESKLSQIGENKFIFS